METRTLFLTMGDQTAEQVATEIAQVILQSKKSIDIAIYDCHLKDRAAEVFVGALRDRVRAGVNVRIAYNCQEVDKNQEMVMERAQIDATDEFVRSIGVLAKRIGDKEARDRPHLMHHKYIVVDAGTPDAVVLMGSGNFTDESWSLQENNYLFIPSGTLASFFATDFLELWSSEDIGGTGQHDGGTVRLSYRGSTAAGAIAFAPGSGEQIDAEVARRIQAAQRRVVIGSGIITSGHILGALGALMHPDRKIPISGVYDRTQMEDVFAQWQSAPSNRWKTEAFKSLVEYGHLSGKASTPYNSTGSVHDFMHNKILVVDDTVITGSYNFSRNAQANAEAILLIDSPQLATDYAGYLDYISQKYSSLGSR